MSRPRLDPSTGVSPGVYVRMPQATLDRLNEHAFDIEAPVAEIIRDAITLYFSDDI